MQPAPPVAEPTHLAPPLLAAEVTQTHHHLPFQKAFA